jgi:release factor glutamine methyltransferase
MQDDLAVDDLIIQGSRTLAACKIANPRREAGLLLRLAANLTPEEVMVGGSRPVDRDSAQIFHAYVSRRGRGEPVSRIRGRREFWSLEFEITPATLDPRPDSEVLVAAVLRLLADHGVNSPSVLDLGTGSGCLLIALLAELPEATGVGADIDPDAISMARRNGATHGVDGRATFVASNWGSAIAGQFDVVLANPPYIQTDVIPELDSTVREFDPLLALDGGKDGLSCYRAIADALPTLLTAGGLAALEVGAGQSSDVVSILSAAGMQATVEWPDLAGIQRCVTGTFG